MFVCVLGWWHTGTVHCSIVIIFLLCCSPYITSARVQGSELVHSTRNSSVFKVPANSYPPQTRPSPTLHPLCLPPPPTLFLPFYPSTSTLPVLHSISSNSLQSNWYRISLPPLYPCVTIATSEFQLPVCVIICQLVKPNSFHYFGLFGNFNCSVLLDYYLILIHYLCLWDYNNTMQCCLLDQHSYSFYYFP